MVVEERLEELVSEDDFVGTKDEEAIRVVDIVEELSEEADIDGFSVLTSDADFEMLPLTVIEARVVDETVLDPIDAVTLGLTTPLGESEIVLEFSGDALGLFV